MPRLVQLYIRHILIGLALSAAFVAGLIWLNVANLQHLILGSDMGWLALVMLVLFNGLVFSGVQFAIAIMNMGVNPDKDDPPRGPKPRIAVAQFAPVPVSEGRDRRQARWPGRLG